MSWLKAVWSELLGLFVDDGRFALAIVIWLIVCGLGVPRLGLPSVFPPVILFAGLLVLLAWSALKRTGERH